MDGVKVRYMNVNFFLPVFVPLAYGVLSSVDKLLKEVSVVNV